MKKTMIYILLLLVIVNVVSAAPVLQRGTGEQYTTYVFDTFWNASGDDIYNTNSGNVGIGTATPNAKFSVDDGNVSLSNGIVSVGSLGSTLPAYGKANTVSEDGSVAIGYGNSITNGKHLSVFNPDNFALGNYNEIDLGFRTVVYGRDNKIKNSKNAIVVGRGIGQSTMVPSKEVNNSLVLGWNDNYGDGQGDADRGDLRFEENKMTYYKRGYHERDEYFTSICDNSSGTCYDVDELNYTSSSGIQERDNATLDDLNIIGYIVINESGDQLLYLEDDKTFYVDVTVDGRFLVKNEDGQARIALGNNLGNVIVMQLLENETDNVDYIRNAGFNFRLYDNVGAPGIDKAFILCGWDQDNGVKNCVNLSIQDSGQFELKGTEFLRELYLNQLSINTTGNVTAKYFKGDGSLLTGISAGTANESEQTFGSLSVSNDASINKTLTVNETIQVGRYINFTEAQGGPAYKATRARGMIYDNGDTITLWGMDNLYAGYYAQRVIDKQCLSDKSINWYDSNECDITNLYQGDSGDANLYFNYFSSERYNASVSFNYGQKWDTNKYSNMGTPHGVLIGATGSDEMGMPLVFGNRINGPPRLGAWMGFNHTASSLMISGDNQPILGKNASVALTIDEFQGGFNVDEVTIPTEAATNTSKHLCIASDDHIFRNDTGCTDTGVTATIYVAGSEGNTITLVFEKGDLISFTES